MAEYAYVTLLLSDSYLPGATVLAHSLKDLETKHELAVMVTPDVSASALKALQVLYDKIIRVPTISSTSLENLNLLGRPDLKNTMTKLSLWKLVQYKKVIFLDADTLVLQCIDDLFDLDADFAAAPDIGWPDIFNSGVFLATPNMGTCAALMQLAKGGVSFDGGDQGLLNTYFSRFHRLSFTYNVTPSASYQYQPAFKHFESQVKVAHFIGQPKPWKYGSSAGFGGAYGQLVARWWAVHDLHRGTSKPAGSTKASEEAVSSGGLLIQSWDGAHDAPPKQGPPQAAGLSFVSFKNQWDEPKQSSFYSPGGTRTPKSVHFERSKELVGNPVFPWEGKDSPQRYFPEDSAAAIEQVRTIPRSGSGTSDDAQPDSLQFSNAWDSHAEIKKYMTEAGIASDKPREPNSTAGSGSHTPREPEMPEGQSSSTDIPGSKTGSKDFMLQDSGVPATHEWNPASAVDKLASHAQTLAEKAAEQAKSAAKNLSGSSKPE